MPEHGAQPVVLVGKADLAAGVIFGSAVMAGLYAAMAAAGYGVFRLFKLL